MASAWEYAPPARNVLDGGGCSSDEDDDGEPVAPAAASTTASGWPALRLPQRWLVAAVSLLFLYWVWSEDRRASPAEPTGTATGPEPVAV